MKATVKDRHANLTVKGDHAPGSGTFCPVRNWKFNGTLPVEKRNPGPVNKWNPGKKKKNQIIVGIRTHAHSFDGPVQLPLRYQDTLIELCLNHTFNIQLIPVFPVS